MIRPKLAALLTAPALALASVALIAPAAQAAAPSNDAFAGATTVSGLGVAVTGTTTGSTTETGEPAPGFIASVGGGIDDIAGSVWYRWTAPASVPVGVRLDASYGQVVTVWTGPSLPTLTEVATGGVLGGLPIGGATMAAGFSASAGATYYFQVIASSTTDEPEAGDDGAFTVSVEQASISGVSAPTVMPNSETGTSAYAMSVMAAVDISVADGLFDKINAAMAAGSDDDPTDVLGPFGSIPTGSVAFGLADGHGNYTLSGLKPGAQYLVFGMRFSQAPGATEDDTPTTRIDGLFYPGTQNPLRYTPLSGPAAGCSYIGLNIDFAANKMATPRLTCPLAPSCAQAKAAAPSAAAVAAAKTVLTKATKTLKSAKKKLKKSPSAAQKKKVKKLSKKLKSSKAASVRLDAATAAVGSACKPL